MMDLEDALDVSDSPGTSPLQPASADRVNQQSNASLCSSIRSSHRDSDVHDKIRQFNNLAHLGPMNAALMSKQLERKTADAALRRAMLGREEAECEMRRYREEVRALRKQIEDGRERERKVGERLETVMENYGRAKETYSHTQAIWEKEIRRARKDTFKSQSTILKLQEELKATRTTIKSIEECYEREKERSKTREQEAFSSRYQLVGVQEELEKALERVKFVEEERDAFKAAAQSEEIARIAAEGRFPLPPEEPDTEFASPRKPRESLSTVDIVSSAASEAEIEDLTRLWQWEKQRADRTQEHLEFVQAECQLRFCQCAKSRTRRSTITSTRKERPAPIAIIDAADLMILGQKSESSPVVSTPGTVETEELVDYPIEPETGSNFEEKVEEPPKLEEIDEHKGPRRGTIFLPSEGIFRTISQQDLEALEKTEESRSEPLIPIDPQPNPSHYSRTPSVDPPTYALMVQERTSLLSLLNAPRTSDLCLAAMDVPDTPVVGPSGHVGVDQDQPAEADIARISPVPTATAAIEEEVVDIPRPHTSAAFYTVTTTTVVPIRDENIQPPPHTVPMLPDSSCQIPSFDVNNPALTPTMTREEALAQIKERRGRARSAAQGAVTPRKQMVTGLGERRDVSAPALRAAKGRS